MIITQIAAVCRSNFFEGYVMHGLGTIVNAAAIVAGSLILITNKTIDKKLSIIHIRKIMLNFLSIVLLVLSIR